MVCMHACSYLDTGSTCTQVSLFIQGLHAYMFLSSYRVYMHTDFSLHTGSACTQAPIFIQGLHAHTGFSYAGFPITRVSLFIQGLHAHRFLSSYRVCMPGCIVEALCCTLIVPCLKCHNLLLLPMHDQCVHHNSKTGHQQFFTYPMINIPFISLTGKTSTVLLASRLNDVIIHLICSISIYKKTLSWRFYFLFFLFFCKGRPWLC